MFTAEQLSYLSDPERRLAALEELHHLRRFLSARRAALPAQGADEEGEVRRLLLEVIAGAIRDLDALARPSSRRA